MNCQDFWNTMPEFGEGEHAHVRECPACAALLEQQRNLARGLQAVAAEWRDVAAPPRLEGRLVSAFRGHNGLAMERRGSGIWVPILTWVAATAAIVALASFLVRERRPEPAQKRAPHRIELAALQPGGDMESGGDSVYGDDSGFIPLPNAARIEPNEDVNLVRVELPRSAMIHLGYAVSAERAAELVQAEVVLGTDGLARAVRFLDD